METTIKLTSSEIAQLWSAYMNDSLAACLLKYFIETAEDKEIKQVAQSTLDVTKSNLEKLVQIFKQDNFPIPHGFSEDDVNIKAPKLFSDPLILQYIKNMGNLGMNAYSIATAISTRTDIRNYFSDCLKAANKYHNDATDLLLSKGIFIRPPYLPYPEEVEYVKKESFLNGFFGDKRPLSSLEIGQLFYCAITNVLGEALMVAYGQTARDKEVRDFIVRGRDIAHKHIKTFSSKLVDEFLPSPSTWESISDSTEPALSDKLMLFHTTFLIAAGIANYGMSIAMCSRRDLGLMYSQLMAECAAYAEDGAKLMIERGWMEKIPGNVDRNALVKQ